MSTAEQIQSLYEPWLDTQTQEPLDAFLKTQPSEEALDHLYKIVTAFVSEKYQVVENTRCRRCADEEEGDYEEDYEEFDEDED